MTSRIRASTPTRHRRLFRTIGIVCGTVFVGSGLFGLTLLFYATRGGSTEMVLDPFLWASATRIRRRAFYVASLCIFTFIGINALSPRKPTILFLRHFGLDINRVVSRAIRAGLGRRFRFLTLDDREFPALATPPLERWLSRLAVPLAAAGLIAWAAVLIPELQQSHDFGADWTLQTAAMVQFWFSFACILFGLALAHLRRVHVKASGTIATAKELDSVRLGLASMAGVTRRSTMLFAQSTVLRVADDLWKQVVADTLDIVDAALVDVSVPSESLRWEIERVHATNLPAVFIAERTHFEEWTARGAKVVDASAILFYDASTQEGGRYFRPHLTQALHDRARPARARVQLRYRLRQALREAAYYGLVGLACLYFGLSLGETITGFVIYRTEALWSLGFWVLVSAPLLLLVVQSLIWMAGRYVLRCRRDAESEGPETVGRTMSLVFALTWAATIGVYASGVIFFLNVPWLAAAVWPGACQTRLWWNWFRAPAQRAVLNSPDATASENPARTMNVDFAAFVDLLHSAVPSKLGPDRTADGSNRSARRHLTATMWALIVVAVAGLALLLGRRPLERKPSKDELFTGSLDVGRLDDDARLQFNPDGRVLAVVLNDVQLWDVETRRLTKRFGHFRGVSTLAFSPDGSTLAVGTQESDSNGHEDKSVTLWNVANGAEVRTVGRQRWVNRVAFSPDGSTLAVATGGADETIRLYDVNSGTRIREFRRVQFGLNTVAFSPDGKRLITAGQDHVVRLWNADTGEELYFPGEQYPSTDAFYDLSGKTIVAFGLDDRVRFWAAEKNQLSGVLRGDGLVVFSPDLKFLVQTKAAEQRVVLKETASGRELHSWKSVEAGRMSVEFSPDAKTLAGLTIVDPLICKVQIWRALP